MTGGQVPFEYKHNETVCLVVLFKIALSVFKKASFCIFATGITGESQETLI